MKRNKYFLILCSALAVLMMTATACSDNDNTPDDGTGNTGNLVTVRFASGLPGDDATPELRTTIDGYNVLWATTDVIGISAVPISGISTTKKYNPARADVTSNFTPADGGKEMELAEGDYTFYSYYPWQDGNNGYEYVQFTLGDFTQSAGDNTDHIGPMDFMYAKTEPISVRSGEDPQITFAYAHAFPMLRVTNETGNSLKYICVRSAMSHVAGKVSINLNNGKVTVVDKEKNIIKLSFSENLSNGSTGTLLLLPQEADTELIIGTEDTEGNIYEITKTAPAAGLAGGKVYEITFKSENLYTPPVMKEGSYQIGNETNLRWLAMAVNYYGKTDVNAQLTADIELNKYTNWEPIGTEETPYKGTFDGKGKTVSKLAINSTLKYYIGFFGYLNKATVSNLHVNGSVTAAQSDWVGGIVGEAENSTISHCLFTGDVRGYNNVGGIVGLSFNGSITGCYTSGSVTGGYLSAGGIVGNSSGNTYPISNCYSSANVTVPYKDAGGIVGSNNSSISTCYATGTVTAPENGGGIAGNNNATGSITGSIALNTALVRTKGTKETFGRVVGSTETDRGATIENCAAWDGMKVIGNAITTGDGGATIHGASLTALQCVTPTTYTGAPYSFDPDVWEFDATWQYLPWNKKLFEYWPDAVKVKVPQEIKDKATSN